MTSHFIGDGGTPIKFSEIYRGLTTAETARVGKEAPKLEQGEKIISQDKV